MDDEYIPEVEIDDEDLDESEELEKDNEKENQKGYSKNFFFHKGYTCL